MCFILGRCILFLPPSQENKLDSNRLVVQFLKLNYRGVLADACCNQRESGRRKRKAAVRVAESDDLRNKGI
jgi:hypothetical protein